MLNYNYDLRYLVIRNHEMKEVVYMAINIKELIDLSKLGENMLLVEKPEPFTKFVDGEDSGEIIGYKYSVVLTEHNFDKIIVKVEQSEPLVTNEQIKKNKTIPVQFEGLEVFPYSFNNRIALSFKAKSISLVK